MIPRYSHLVTIIFVYLTLILPADAAIMGLPDVTIIAFITIFIILSLLTLRETLRLREARRILKNIERERIDEKLHNKSFLSTTVEEISVKEEIEKQKIKQQSMKPDAFFEELLSETSLNTPPKPKITSSRNSISHPQPKSENGVINNETSTPVNLSPEAFDKGFLVLATPIERYFNHLNLQHLLQQAPSRLQWFNIIKNLNSKISSNPVINLIQLATHNDEIEDTPIFSINECIADLVAGTREIFPKVDFKLDTNVTSSLEGNITELRRLILSVLCNAANANEMAKSPRPVKISASQIDQIIIFSVRDHGKGLDVETTQNVLSPSYNLSSNKAVIYDRFYLIREYLQLHGESSITIHTNPKKGTKITLFLESS